MGSSVEPAWQGGTNRDMDRDTGKAGEETEGNTAEEGWGVWLN